MQHLEGSVDRLRMEIRLSGGRVARSDSRTPEASGRDQAAFEKTALCVGEVVRAAATEQGEIVEMNFPPNTRAVGRRRC